jgi:3-phenylpropionate/trans-cinnamate dioxygenase ferredoxin subunit
MESMRVAGAADIPDGSMRRVEAGGEAVLVANVGGEFYAIANTCSHRGGDLSKGTIQDGIVQCPRHGSKFDVRSGGCLEGPKILGKMFATGPVRAYSITVDGEDILVGGE